MEDNWLGVRGNYKKKGGGEGQKLRNIILFQNPKILFEDILKYLSLLRADESLSSSIVPALDTVLYSGRWAGGENQKENNKVFKR